MRAENNTSKGERERGLNYNLSDWHGALWCSGGSKICVIFGNNACGGA